MTVTAPRRTKLEPARVSTSAPDARCFRGVSWRCRFAGKPDARCAMTRIPEETHRKRAKELRGARENVRDAGDPGPRFLLFPASAAQIFLVSPRETWRGQLCVRGTYASLRGPVRGVQATPADKDKVTLRNCFPWDEAKPVATPFSGGNLFFFASFRGLRTPPLLATRGGFFLFPFTPILSLLPRVSTQHRSPRLILIPLQLSSLSTSFRRDARRQRASESKRRRQRTREAVQRPLSLHEARLTLRLWSRGKLTAIIFVTIAVSIHAQNFRASPNHSWPPCLQQPPRPHCAGETNWIGAILPSGFPEKLDAQDERA